MALHPERCVTMTEVLPPTPEGLARAAAILRAGGLVAFPTETVYGLGADATSDAGVAAIYAAKGRPDFNPLIVHVDGEGAARRFGVLDRRAEKLSRQFWPGPLTLVLPLAEGHGLAARVTAGLGTVGLRVPANRVARGLLQAFGGALAAPSANPSGRVSPTTAAHVLEGLSGRIDAVIDGGPCAVGVESTIVGLGGPATLLRPGGVPVEALAKALMGPLAEPGAAVAAPGMLPSHYAPAARLRLEAERPRLDEIFVGFGPGGGALNLSETGNVVEAAARLFAVLRQADALAGPEGMIAVAPVPEAGLGRAINDRLRRAAAPR
jgi:L-threonylcarbamoyladenylate synthase